MTLASLSKPKRRINFNPLIRCLSVCLSVYLFMYFCLTFSYFTYFRERETNYNTVKAFEVMRPWRRHTLTASFVADDADAGAFAGVVTVMQLSLSLDSIFEWDALRVHIPSQVARPFRWVLSVGCVKWFKIDHHLCPWWSVGGGKSTLSRARRKWKIKWRLNWFCLE